MRGYWETVSPGVSQLDLDSSNLPSPRCAFSLAEVCPRWHPESRLYSMQAYLLIGGIKHHCKQILIRKIDVKTNDEKIYLRIIFNTESN
jgi:hypothetical protein